MQRLEVKQNKLKEVPDGLKELVRLQHLDLSNNQIAFIHPDFNQYGNAKYARLYWKLKGNPLKTGQIGGIFI